MRNYKRKNKRTQCSSFLLLFFNPKTRKKLCFSLILFYSLIIFLFHSLIIYHTKLTSKKYTSIFLFLFYFLFLAKVNDFLFLAKVCDLPSWTSYVLFFLNSYGYELIQTGGVWFVPILAYRKLTKLRSSITDRRRRCCDVRSSPECPQSGAYARRTSPGRRRSTRAPPSPAIVRLAPRPPPMGVCCRLCRARSGTSSASIPLRYKL